MLSAATYIDALITMLVLFFVSIAIGAIIGHVACRSIGVPLTALTVFAVVVVSPPDSLISFTLWFGLLIGFAVTAMTLRVRR